MGFGHCQSVESEKGVRGPKELLGIFNGHSREGDNASGQRREKDRQQPKQRGALVIKQRRGICMVQKKEGFAKLKMQHGFLPNERERAQ